MDPILFELLFFLRLVGGFRASSFHVGGICLNLQGGAGSPGSCVRNISVDAAVACK
jgi:hypothetical protein